MSVAGAVFPSSADLTSAQKFIGMFYWEIQSEFFSFHIYLPHTTHISLVHTHMCGLNSKLNHKLKSESICDMKVWYEWNLIKFGKWLLLASRCSSCCFSLVGVSIWCRFFLQIHLWIYLIFIFHYLFFSIYNLIN